MLPRRRERPTGIDFREPRQIPGGEIAHEAPATMR